MGSRMSSKRFPAASAGAWLIAYAACSFPKPADVPQCVSSTDCTSAGSPICVAGSCVAAGACAVDEDCAGVAGKPYCQTAEGSCVGCLDGSSCPTSMPVCDATSHSCQACDRDDQCPSGVCVDAEGRCALDNEVVFLRSLNSADNPTCSAAAPCQNFPAALAATTAQRYIVHILGGSFAMNAGVELPGRRLYVDGSDTIVSSVQGATFSSSAASLNITLGRMTIGAVSGSAIVVSGTGALQLEKVTLTAPVTITGGSLEVRASALGRVTCSGGGTLDIERSTVTTPDDSNGLPIIESTNCTLTLRADQFFSDGAGLLETGGGKITVMNNVFVGTIPSTDPLGFSSPLSGSRFAFNTVVNFSGLDGTATVINCDSSLDVSSNIFAWNSSARLSACIIHDSLFDDFVPASALGSNHQASSLAIFLDFNAKDLHLSPTSPALGLGEPGITDVDLAGHPRPSPAGTRPDVGAYESP